MEKTQSDQILIGRGVEPSACHAVLAQIQARFEEMLSVLEAVRSDLEQNHDGLIYFIKDCNAWRRDWNQWNYKQQGR